jgi:hypothetical protein
VREPHREPLDPEPVVQRRGQHLEVEAETVDGAEREQPARDVGAERLQPTLRVAKRQTERDVRHQRERPSRKLAQEAVPAVDLRFGQLPGADRDVGPSRDDRLQHRP